MLPLSAASRRSRSRWTYSQTIRPELKRLASTTAISTRELTCWTDAASAVAAVISPLASATSWSTAAVSRAEIAAFSSRALRARSRAAKLQPAHRDQPARPEQAVLEGRELLLGARLQLRRKARDVLLELLQASA